MGHIYEFSSGQKYELVNISYNVSYPESAGIFELMNDYYTPLKAGDVFIGKESKLRVEYLEAFICQSGHQVDAS